MNIDNQILRVLKKNSRMSDREISTVLGVSEEEVSARILDLEQRGVILGYTCVVNDTHMTQDSIRALIEVKINPEKDKGFDQIASIVAQLPNIVDHYLISGAYDFLLVVQGENLREISSFVFDHLATIEHVVSTQTHFIMKKYKDSGIIFPHDMAPSILPVTP